MDLLYNWAGTILFVVGAFLVGAPAGKPTMTEILLLCLYAELSAIFWVLRGRHDADKD